MKGEELVEINIPAGVDNDMVVTVEGRVTKASTMVSTETYR